MKKKKIETATLNGVGTNLAVGYGYMLGMNGVAFECLFAFEGAVEHDIGIG